MNALPVLTDYTVNNYTTSSITLDPAGNSYFTYMVPYTFLSHGTTSFDLPDPIPFPYYTNTGHIPSPQYSWLTYQVSLDTSGALRWKRDITQWDSIPYSFTADFTDIGGYSGVNLPIPNNVLLQLPCSKFLLTVREIRGLGVAYRPDMWLEICDSSNGNTVQFIYLPLSFDTLLADLDDGGGAPIANKDERNYYVTDVKIRTATTEAGIDWCVVYTEHRTRDTTLAAPEYHIDLYMAPGDGNIGTWSAVGSWIPTSGTDHFPNGDFWDTLCVSDGSMHWIEGQFSGPDFKWQVYKRDL